MTKVSHPDLDYRPDIDGLRAVAVLLVVAFHAAARRVPGGFIGVDVFFVISGFLITGVILRGLENDRFHIGVFYERRIRRIFPALAVVLVATWIGGWLMLEPKDFSSLGEHIAGGAGFVANIMLFRESGYFDTDAALKPLLHLWSLGIEEQFYIVWPLLLVLAWKRRQTIVPLLLGTLAASFFFGLWQIRRDPSAAFYLPGSRVWELAAGAVLAYVTLFKLAALEGVRSQRIASLGTFTLRARDLASITGVALIVGGAFALDSGPTFPGWRALIPVVGAVLCIGAGPLAWLNSRVLSHRAAVWVGLISYPLYLWHWPLLVFVRRTSLFQEHGPLVALSAVVVAIAASAITYTFVELPLRTRFDGRPRFWMANLGGALLGCAFIGIGTVYLDGVPSRYPPQVRSLLTYSYDYKTNFRFRRCFLASGAHRFLPECTGDSSNGAVNRLAIWGDSHAAMLYSSLNQRSKPFHTFVMQLSIAGCPPAAGGDFSPRNWCDQDNPTALAEIDRYKPATVVLAANWQDEIQARAIPLLGRTVARLRAAGVNRIILFGPVPQWNLPLPTAIARYVRFKNLNSFPERMSFSVDPSTLALNASLRATAQKLGIEFVSPYEELCQGMNCLTTVGDGISGITAYDNAHLTAAGSNYVIGRALHTFFPPKLSP